MESETFETALFPLSAHILPGGVMSLRIFEPRYLRMVKQACASQSGFVICMYNARGDETRNQHIFRIGTYVSVEDFDLLEDGLLGITVKGHRCVAIESISTESDQLRMGQCRWLDNWQGDIGRNLVAPMDHRLKELFNKYPEVKSLYPEPRFDDPVWVVYRWLELIPVDANQKQAFLAEKDCGKALEFLSQLVE